MDSGLTKVGLLLLAFSSALAIYNSRGDASTVSFVLTADAALLLLFACLHRFDERARAGAGGGRRRIKAAVWALSTLLTAMFASRVAPLMPPVVAAVVWLMAVASSAAGGWALLLN